MYVPLENIHKVTLTPHNVHNAANVVYISAASDPASSFEADKNFRPGSYNGTVTLNDVVLTEGTDYAFMTSYSPNALYSVQLLNGRTWNTGDKLSISGQFAYNGTTEGIEVSGFMMWFDGINWSTTEVVLKTPGDLNNDGAWTVLDLVRFKKYLARGIAAEYKSVTELTGDGVVDHNDVQELRYIILGKHQVIDGQIVMKYLSDDKINIFADGPVVQNNDALVKAYFNAGFTTLVMTEDFTGAMDADGNTGITNADGTLDDDYRNCITTALKYGDVMVRNHSNTSDYFTKNLYTQLYDLGVRQFYIWDEPTPQNNGFFGIGKEEGDIPAVAVMADSFAKQLPSDVLFHVNLLPSYGTGKGSSWGGKISHDAYVEQYVTDVVSKLPAHRQTLSVDNYPLLSSNTIRESYLKDLWYIGNKAKMARTDGKDVVVNYCIQAFSDSSSTELRTPETRADLSFQVNTGLALGAQSFEYFEYYDYDVTSDSINGILFNGLYDQVQSINRELRAWDHIFLSFDWQGVKTYNTAAAYINGVTELGSLQSITVSADQATLVGEYKYGNTEEYGYMITNFTEPSAGTTDTVTLMMAANQSVLVYKNGTGRWMNADSDGKLTLALEAGGGAFVIPQ